MLGIYRVYGADGHRQRESFFESDYYHFGGSWGDRKILIKNSDKTGTNDYTEVVIKCADPDIEIRGQITDGIFENSRTGKVEKKIDGVWKEYALFC